MMGVSLAGKMKYFSNWSIILLILISSWNCDEDKPADYWTYPLDVGNVWEYQRTITLIFYTDSSGTRVNQDTTIWASYPLTSSVVGTRNFGDTLSTIEVVVSSSSAGVDENTRTFYTKTANALYSVAYSGGGMYALPKQIEPKQFVFHGQYFRDITQFSSALQMGLIPGNTRSDSIYFESPPVQALAFPLKVGSEWDYRPLGHPFHMGRRVISQSNLELDSMSYACYQVNTLYDFFNDGAWDDDLGMTDYYADLGLIQREIKVLGNLESHVQGGLTGRKYDWYDKYILTNSVIAD